MSTRKITATAKSTSQSIRITAIISIDGLNKGGFDQSQQRAKVKRFKNSIYDLLSCSGFDYEDISIK